MTDLVSILIPAYNAERWIRSTIKSALAQTWPRIEVIVVDDGSRDATLAASQSVQSPRVKVVTQHNMGAPGARNRALALAQGTFIQWLDADDLLDPDKITRQMNVANAIGDPRFLLSGSFGTFYYRPEKALFTRTSLWRDLDPIDYFVTRFRDNVCFQTDAWLVSRTLTEAAGPWTDISPDDDGEYFCRVVARSAGVRFVEDARTYYRVGNFSSLSKAMSESSRRALFQSKVQCIQYLLALEDSPRTRAAAVQLLQDWLPYFYPESPLIVEEAHRLAGELGGALRQPQLKWKYRPIELLFGHAAAVRASRALPKLRAQTTRNWDGLLYRFMSMSESGAAPPQIRRGA
jgi:glycosyltransferase involved in cell wall biosynthesis